MKKTTIFTFIFFICSTFVFSQGFEISTGVGFYTGIDFNTLKAEIKGGEYKQKYNQANIGGVFFFDLTYFEADILFLGTSTKFKSNSYLKKDTLVAEDWELRGVNLDIQLLAKIPINVTSDWKIFPVFGFQFDISLSKTYSKDYELFENTSKGDSYGRANFWNSTKLKIGFGMDYSFSGPYYFRTELFYDYKFRSRLDTSFNYTIADNEDNLEYLKNTTNGFSVKLLVGIKLKSAAYSEPRRRERGPNPPRGGGGGSDIYYPKR
ncbi:MAG: hypothetical protein Ta2F_14980 [Termitinemataceae bacterium]|nr:MAG: hypothetical protein Ta2F_14980 [Termitinemataceae bacterium]